MNYARRESTLLCTRRGTSMYRLSKDCRYESKKVSQHGIRRWLVVKTLPLIVRRLSEPPDVSGRFLTPLSARTCGRRRHLMCGPACRQHEWRARKVSAITGIISISSLPLMTVHLYRFGPYLPILLWVNSNGGSRCSEIVHGLKSFEVPCISLSEDYDALNFIILYVWSVYYETTHFSENLIPVRHSPGPAPLNLSPES